MDSVGLRFFSAGVDLSAAAKWAAQVDYRNRFGLVALTGADHRIVGHAVYERTGDDRAEVAFEVADVLQGQGLGTILLAHLAEAAEEQGVSVFEAQVLPQNHRMIGVFRESGFGVRMRSQPDLVVVEIPTSLSPDAIKRFEERDRSAAAAALDHFLRPRSVAVIGAGRKRGTVGGEIFHNLLSHAFNGPVHPVNPSADVVQSVPACRVSRAGTWGCRAGRDLRPSALRGRDRPAVCAEGRACVARDLGRIRRNGQ